MDPSNEKMKWILFSVFITLFTLAVLGTLGMFFLGFGLSKLKMLNKNYPFWVCGEISRLHGINIDLINADISV